MQKLLKSYGNINKNKCFTEIGCFALGFMCVHRFSLKNDITLKQNNYCC